MDVHALLAGFTGLWVYILIGAFVGLASVAPPGWFIPGQTFAVTGGVMASAGLLEIPATTVTVFVGANIGCAIGYGLGALYASRKPGWRPKGRFGRWWSYAREMLERRTVVAIMVGRWSAALRACLPNAAGVSRVGWIRFLVWNALACAVWSPVVVGVGVAVHHAASLAQAALSVTSSFVFLAIATAMIIGYRKWINTSISTEQVAGESEDVVVLTAPEPDLPEGDSA